jgi:hypothetical protein
MQDCITENGEYPTVYAVLHTLNASLPRPVSVMDEVFGIGLVKFDAPILSTWAHYR